MMTHKITKKRIGLARLRRLPGCVAGFSIAIWMRVQDTGPTSCSGRRGSLPRLSRILQQKEDTTMPEKETLEAARRDLRQGKSPSTAAGEFVREEIDHVREGKHGARSAKQAIAIGLSKARRAGIPLGAPNPKTTTAATRRKAARDTERGEESPATGEEGSTKRGRSRMKAMKREPKNTVSRAAHRRRRRRARERDTEPPRISAALAAVAVAVAVAAESAAELVRTRT